MAGRKDKNTVDYFPHYCASGKTIFILENQFGHLGYYIWFKTLEILGNNENHYIDLRDETDLLFLISKMKITEQQLNNIYNLLAKLGAIDLEMWNEKIIFSENFVKNITDAYKRRNKDVYGKAYLCEHILNLCIHKSKKRIHKSTKESILEESILEESKDGVSVFNYLKFISLFNEVTKRNFKGDSKSESAFNARIKKYNEAEFGIAIRNAYNDDYLRQNPKYLTPEYLTRENQLEKWLNVIEGEKPKVIETKRNYVDFDQVQPTEAEYKNDPFLKPIL